MQLDLDRLGHDEPHGHLRDRHQPRPERHQRQQPRAARAAAAARGGQPPGRGRAEALDLDPAGADHVVAGRALRHDLHQQLRADQRLDELRRTAGRRRRLAVRRLGLFDAHLAPARQARPVQSDARRHRRRDPRAERAVRRRPVRRGADERAAGLHLLGDDAAAGWSTRTQFENIILRSDENGGALRLKDVARVELGAQNYGFSGTFNGSPAVPIGVYLQPGANALQVAGMPSRPRWSASPSASRTGCATTSRSTPRASSRSRSRRSIHHLRRGDRAGRAGGLPVPAELAGDADPGASPCRCRSSAPSPACTCWASRSTC